MGDAGEAGSDGARSGMHMMAAERRSESAGTRLSASRPGLR